MGTVGNHLGGGTTRGLARTAGWLTLALALLGMFGPLALKSLVVDGDAAATAQSMGASPGVLHLALVCWIGIVSIDIALSATFYLLLAPAGRLSAMVAAGFRLVYSALLSALLVLPFLARSLLTGGAGDVRTRQSQALAALGAFDVGFLVGLVFFGLHLCLVGTILLRHGFVPRPLGGLVLAAGVGYLGDSLLQLMGTGGGWVSAVLLTPSVLGEVGLALWLVARGTTPPRL